MDKLLSQDEASSLHWSDIYNQRYTQVVISDRCLAYRDHAVSFHGEAGVLPVDHNLQGKTILDAQIARGTQSLWGFYREGSAFSFFLKPQPSTRAVDCLGFYGPNPDDVHLIGQMLVMLSWKD